ncbi:MAG: hypothetical protein RQ758_04305 [Methanomicrobiaceae archaeon]|nr:hypothetical protein [Methanomicrobiaceae archaeon]
MKVTTETKIGPACMIGRRTIRVVERWQALATGPGMFLTAVPVGIEVTEGEHEYYYPLEGAP